MVGENKPAVPNSDIAMSDITITSSGRSSPTQAEKPSADKDTKTKEPKKKVHAVSYYQLYRYASGRDWVFVILGSVCSISMYMGCADPYPFRNHPSPYPYTHSFCLILFFFLFQIALGVGQPLVALLFGNVVDDLARSEGDKGPKIIKDVKLFAIVGCAMFVAAYGQQCFWTLSAEHQSKRIREKYFHAILRQDMGWHDTGKANESLTTRLSSDTQLIFDGLADKVGLTLSNLTTFIAGFIIGFIKGWKLSLVLLAAVPIIGGM
jgi:ATP-binding cassette subfamily B (MDR/TAP) protein 1